MKKSYKFLRRCYAIAAAIFVSGNVMAQSITVTGTVTDTSGAPLLGVTVMVDGTTTGTATGLDGTYSIKAPSVQSVLVYSFMGYASQSVTVGNQTRIDVALAEDAEAIEDVIVIGYGTIKKSDLTGAVSHVGQSDIQERPVTDALQAMQGKVPGVDITSSMRPGELGTVRIRGTRSKNASNDPLYVVDGMPLSAGSMTDINPNDIESIDILKDASATAIYGSRGANGVILITTKKGDKGRVSVNYDGSVTLGWAKSIADWATSGELLERSHLSSQSGGLYNNSRYYAAGDKGYGAADPYSDFNSYLAYPYMLPVVASAYQFKAIPDQAGYRGYTLDLNNPVLVPGTDYLGNAVEGGIPVFTPENMYDHDWTKLVTRIAVTNNHQISISGGTDKARIYASAAVLDDKPIQIDQDYRRFTFNMNGEVKAKWFTMGMSNNVSYTIRNYGYIDRGNAAAQYTGERDIYGRALAMGRSIPAYYLDWVLGADGTVTGVAETDELLQLDRNVWTENAPGVHNPLVNKDQGFNEYRIWSAMNSTYVELQLTPWLRWRSNFGGQYRQARNGSYYTKDFTNPFGTRVADSEPKTAYYKTATSTSWTLENLLYIDKTFGKHTFGATLLQSAEESESESVYMRAYNMQFDSAKWYKMSGTANGYPTDFDTTYTRTRLASYMARLNYSFDDRFLLTLTGRYDGASVLANGHKWDFFPSVSLAWRIDQEEFMRNQNLFSQLKLRVGYGETGNSSVSAYGTQGSIVQANTVFGSAVAFAVKSDAMPNALLGWEKTGQWNVGIDFGFLNNRLSGAVEAYRADTRDLLMGKSLSGSTGYDKVQSNIGKTRNTGVEVSLTSRNIENKDFSWTTTLSWGLNRDQVTETIYGPDLDDASNNMYIGESLRTLRDLKYDRLLSTSDEDARLIALYNGISSYNFHPGLGLFVDQPFYEVGVNATQDLINQYGTKTANISWTDQAGAVHQETVEYVNNGFGVANTSTTASDSDLKILGTYSPKWSGGLNNTFTYKNWSLNFYIYARFGNIYNNAGRYMSSMSPNYNDYWREDNQDAKYPVIRSFSKSTDYSSYMYNVVSNNISVRNIALSYNLPQNFLNKVSLNSGQVYAQILNPFLFSNLKKYGINNDDVNGWEGNSYGGTTNNSVMYQSFVLGLRLGF